jgi:hypothetical protein
MSALGREQAFAALQHFFRFGQGADQAAALQQE